MAADNRQAQGRNYSNNTIQMLNESDYEQRDLGMDMLNVTNYSTILQQEQNPERLREFYKHFTQAIKNNKKKRIDDNIDEVNLIDLLIDLRMLSPEWTHGQRAVATSMIKQ